MAKKLTIGERRLVAAIARLLAAEGPAFDRDERSRGWTPQPVRAVRSWLVGPPGAQSFWQPGFARVRDGEEDVALVRRGFPRDYGLVRLALLPIPAEKNPLSRIDVAALAQGIYAVDLLLQNVRAAMKRRSTSEASRALLKSVEVQTMLAMLGL